MASTKKKAAARSKPTKSRPVASSTISQPAAADLSPLLSAFSPDGSLFALITLAFDKHRLRIYNTASQRAVAEYTLHTARVHCMQWINSSTLADPTSDESKSPEKKRKKKKKGKSSEEQGKLEDVVILGLSDGVVVFFSPGQSKVVHTLSHSSSTSPVLSIASIGHALWTSSSDHILRLWDIPSNMIVQQSKNSDRQSYTAIGTQSVVTEENTQLLAATHQIKLISSQTGIQDSTAAEVSSFTGHASPVKVLRWSTSQATSDRFYSSAENDRFIYLWQTPQNATSLVKPTATISLDSDVRRFTTSTAGSKSEFLVTLSTSGKVTIIPVPEELPSRSKEGSGTGFLLLPRTTIGIETSDRQSPIADVAFTSDGEPTVRVARLVKGVKPVFDLVKFTTSTGEFVQSITLPEIQDQDVDDEDQAIPTKRYTEHSVAVGTGQDMDLGLDVDHESLEVDGSLQVDLAELSLGQRLKAVENTADSGEEDKPASGKSRSKKSAKVDVSSIPANSLTRTLIQALHSSDSRLLEMCLAHSDPTLIQNTVQRLPPQLTVPLITACVERLSRGSRAANMKGGGGGASSQRGMGLITWIKTVLAVHAGHLMAMPDLVARLSGLHSALTARLGLYESLLSLNGRLDMVLSQVEMRALKRPAPLATSGVEGRSRGASHYVEGDSDEEDDKAMEVEVTRDDDEGSVEDIELGGDSESDDSEVSEEAEESDDDSDANEFIDDEAEEDDESEDSEGSD